MTPGLSAFTSKVTIIGVPGSPGIAIEVGCEVRGGERKRDRRPGAAIGGIERDLERSLPPEDADQRMKRAFELERGVLREPEGEGSPRGSGQDHRRDAVLLADLEGPWRLAFEQQVEGLVARVADGQTEKRGREIARVAGAALRVRGHDRAGEKQFELVRGALGRGGPVEANPRTAGGDVPSGERLAVDRDLEALIGDALVRLDVEHESAIPWRVEVDRDRGSLADPQETLPSPHLRISAETLDEVGLRVRPAEHQGGTIRDTRGEGEAVGEVEGNDPGPLSRLVDPKTCHGQKAAHDQDRKDATHLVRVEDRGRATLVRNPLWTYIGPIMATQIELIDTYKKELSKLKVKVDDVLLKAVVKSLGPAVYRDDASKISAADADELERVKQNFMIRRLGLPSGPKLDVMLNKAIDQMGRSKTAKHRAVLYYIITRDSKREAALL